MGRIVVGCEEEFQSFVSWWCGDDYSYWLCGYGGWFQCGDHD